MITALPEAPLRPQKPILQNTAGVAGATLAVVRRATAEGFRDPGPALFLPGLPPLAMAVAFTAQFDRISEVVTLPTGSFAEFVIPGLIVAVALASGGFTSAQLAQDLRSGFMDRLRLYHGGVAPLLLGRFVYEGLRVVPATVAVMALGLAIGGTNSNGAPGLAMVVLLTMLLGSAFAGLHLTVATLTEDPNTPLNLQPLGPVMVFLSSAIVPPQAMPRWAELIATYNPVTPVVDAGRAAMIGELTGPDVRQGLAIACVWLAVSVGFTLLVVSRKIARG